MSYRLTKEKILAILEKNESFSHIKDMDSLLDQVLTEARAITNADAGSIYLLRGGKLAFEYVQNDTLMRQDSSSNRYLYSKQEVEINNCSISGYVAANRQPLIIDDVYRLSPDVPYTFNRSFDESSTYRTHSMLTVPLVTTGEKITGVLQIINARDGKGGVIPFKKDDEVLVTMFANQAAVAIERARMTREIILRMIKMAELRDPKETGAHVNRVGAYSIEIYQRWAKKKGIPEKRIKEIKDIMRIAAMLHDVGKVAISDTLLKKNARFTPEEREIMKLHTIHGARLFVNSNSDWDDMAAEIALNHHEKWDGTGYPGHLEDVYSGDKNAGPGKKGEEIPLSARIVALADVYDALVSQRIYKQAWDEQEVVKYINEEKGKHFDPELVEVFNEIYDVIRAVRSKYPG